MKLHVEQNKHPNTDGTPWGIVAEHRHPAGGGGSGPPGISITWRGVRGRKSAEELCRAVNSTPDPAAVRAAAEEIASARQTRDFPAAYDDPHNAAPEVTRRRYQDWVEQIITRHLKETE